MDAASKTPVIDARLQVDNTSFTTSTSAEGDFWRLLPPGVHTLTAVGDSHLVTSVPLQVAQDGSVKADGETVKDVVVPLEKSQEVMGMPRLSFIFLAGMIKGL